MRSYSLDVDLTSIEIWRHHYAKGVFKIISHVIVDVGTAQLLQDNGVRSQMLLPL